mmetsp:Transcript_53295/g.157655  ORF Transcript_53295/g.157655 Transcript_53295/m.157655 type:complete len:205 (+) Transcript_53295:567-1181(+)
MTSLPAEARARKTPGGDPVRELSSPPQCAAPSRAAGEAAGAAIPWKPPHEANVRISSSCCRVAGAEGSAMGATSGASTSRASSEDMLRNENDISASARCLASSSARCSSSMRWSSSARCSASARCTPSSAPVCEARSMPEWSSSMESSRWLMVTIWSPKRRPAASAGPPGTTSLTTRPGLSPKPNLPAVVRTTLQYTSCVPTLA